jgi:general secretion pathway protein D
LVLAAGSSLQLLAESAGSLYKKGVDADARQQYEAAYEYFKEAYEKKPKDIRYREAVDRERFYAAITKVHRGQQLRQQGNLQQALTQFQNAAAIDPSLQIAQQEATVTQQMMEQQVKPAAPQGQQPPQSQSAPPPPKSNLADLLNAASGPVELQPISNQPITLKMTEDSKMIYETIGKLAGINVLFDPDYTSRRIKIELNNVSLEDALAIVALESRTFWRPVTRNTIFVAADNPQKRKELEENVVKTFYLSNISQPTDLQDIVNALRTILEIQRIQQLPSQNAIVIRATPDQMALAEKMINDIDKAKPEVVVDLLIMQVDRNKARNLGILPPQTASVALTNQSFQNLGQCLNGSGTGCQNNNTNNNNNNNNSSGNQQQPGGNLTFNSFKHLSSVSYAVTLPGATANFLFNDNDSKVLQNPQIRALDGEKASLKIGDRVPVATGSFGIPTAGVAATGGLIANTQFQYIDVGVNVDITPKVHADGDITLKVAMDVSSVTGQVNIGGINQPEIGQRKIEHLIRLKEGEVNVMGGLFEDQEVNSWSGIPGLAKIPLFKYLFASQNKTSDVNEIVFVMVPHIVRRQIISDLNNKALDIGTGSNIELRRAEPVETSYAPPPNPLAFGTQQPAAAPQPATMPQQVQAQANPTAEPQEAQPPAANANAMQNQAPQPGVPAGSVGGTVAGQPQQPVAAPTAPETQPAQNNQPSPATAPHQMAVLTPAPRTSMPTGPMNGALLSFEPPSTTLPAGSTATVNVMLNTAQPVDSVSMQLKFDPKLLQLVNVANGGFMQRDGQPATLVHRDDGNGTLQVSAVRSPSAPGVSGQGTLLTLVFQLKAPGTTTISPASVAAQSTGGVPVTTGAQGAATVQIQPGPSAQTPAPK